MGKSTVAAMLAKQGIPVHEADDEVHALLSPKGKAFRAIAKAFPALKFPQIYGRRLKTGRYIKRLELGKIVFKDAKALAKLEKILHPLVRNAQNDFIRKHRNAGQKIVALDIPLLFETEGESLVDYTFVASAPYNVQRGRVLARPGMNEKKFQAIVKKQMPDGEKRARADYVIHTGLGLATTMKDIKAALRDIKKKI